MKSVEKKTKLLKEEIKTKDQQLIEAEDKAVFAETEVEVQRRVFVRKFLALAIDTTSTKNFAQVIEVLEATKSQPDNQQEQDARSTRMGEKVQATYKDFIHTIMQQIEDLWELVDPTKDLELKTEEEYRDEENTSMNTEGLLQKEFQTHVANTQPDLTLFAWGKEDQTKTSPEEEETCGITNEDFVKEANEDFVRSAQGVLTKSSEETTRRRVFGQRVVRNQMFEGILLGVQTCSE
ncbi:hypothetical protein R1sor_004259 [Riccia sorocarpa]|uniref:Uncharacterized protein n=1 Tax=Riccia sorocarpa TaxID=122646 RepID=A0ABD3H401_9MARC